MGKLKHKISPRKVGWFSQFGLFSKLLTLIFWCPLHSVPRANMENSPHLHPFQNYRTLWVEGPSAHLIQCSASAGFQTPTSCLRPPSLCLNTYRGKASLFVNVPLPSYLVLISKNHEFQNFSQYPLLTDPTLPPEATWIHPTPLLRGNLWHSASSPSPS